MLLPTRPNFSESEDQADVCAASKHVPFNMNQSFFQMITAATSNLRMSSRFDEDSEEDTDADEEDNGAAIPSSVDKGKSKATDRNPWVSSFSRLHSIEETGDLNRDATGSEVLEPPSKFGPAPFMSQILEAQAQMNPTNFSAAAQRNEIDMFGGEKQLQQVEKSSELSKKLMEIFGLSQMEQVVSGEPPKKRIKTFFKVQGSDVR